MLIRGFGVNRLGKGEGFLLLRELDWGKDGQVDHGVEGWLVGDQLAQVLQVTRLFDHLLLYSTYFLC